jgi:repressor LexA
MKQELTEKQRRVLQFVAHKIWQKKRPPTIREIAQNFKFSSTGTVRDYLRVLQDKGYIRLTKKKSRSIGLISKKLLQIPIVAQVYAGSPTLTYENIEDYFDLERLIFRHEQTFALRVKGDSMVEAGIMPDDLVLVQKQSTCENGDIIVALIDEETTIKYFRRRKDKIYLEPANKNYVPILIKRNIAIIGKVISVIRNYV